MKCRIDRYTRIVILLLAVALLLPGMAIAETGPEAQGEPIKLFFLVSDIKNSEFLAEKLPGMEEPLINAIERLETPVDLYVAPIQGDMMQAPADADPCVWLFETLASLSVEKAEISSNAGKKLAEAVKAAAGDPALIFMLFGNDVKEFKENFKIDAEVADASKAQLIFLGELNDEQRFVDVTKQFFDPEDNTTASRFHMIAPDAADRLFGDVSALVRLMDDASKGDAPAVSECLDEFAKQAEVVPEGEETEAPEATEDAADTRYHIVRFDVDGAESEFCELTGVEGAYTLTLRASDRECDVINVYFSKKSNAGIASVEGEYTVDSGKDDPIFENYDRLTVDGACYGRKDVTLNVAAKPAFMVVRTDKARLHVLDLEDLGSALSACAFEGNASVLNRRDEIGCTLPQEVSDAFVAAEATGSVSIDVELQWSASDNGEWTPVEGMNKNLTATDPAAAFVITNVGEHRIVASVHEDGAQIGEPVVLTRASVSNEAPVAKGTDKNLGAFIRFGGESNKIELTGENALDSYFSDNESDPLSYCFKRNGTFMLFDGTIDVAASELDSMDAAPDAVPLAGENVAEAPSAEATAPAETDLTPEVNAIDNFRSIELYAFDGIAYSEKPVKVSWNVYDAETLIGDKLTVNMQTPRAEALRYGDLIRFDISLPVNDMESKVQNHEAFNAWLASGAVALCYNDVDLSAHFAGSADPLNEGGVSISNFGVEVGGGTIRWHFDAELLCDPSEVIHAFVVRQNERIYAEDSANRSVVQNVAPAWGNIAENTFKSIFIDGKDPVKSSITIDPVKMIDPETLEANDGTYRLIVECGKLRFVRGEDAYTFVQSPEGNGSLEVSWECGDQTPVIRFVLNDLIENNVKAEVFDSVTLRIYDRFTDPKDDAPEGPTPNIKTLELHARDKTRFRNTCIIIAAAALLLIAIVVVIVLRVRKPSFKNEKISIQYLDPDDKVLAEGKCVAAAWKKNSISLLQLALLAKMPSTDIMSAAEMKKNSITMERGGLTVTGGKTNRGSKTLELKGKNECRIRIRLTPR